MGGFFSLIENLATGLYVISGFLLVWNLRILWLARGELQYAQFGLEKELAERRGGKALTMVILMVEAIGAVWAISNISSPAWSEGLPYPTPTAMITFATGAPPGSGVGSGINIQNTGPTDIAIPATFAPPSTPQGTIGPRDSRSGCDPSHAWIEYPANGMYIFQTEDIVGTASIDNFSKYRFEIRSIDSDQFSVLPDDHSTPVLNGKLGNFVPFYLLPGEYRFRLVVFNTNSEVAARCEITVWVTDPVPTATPIGGGVVQVSSTPSE